MGKEKENQNTHSKTKGTAPSPYKVILLNDNNTPVDFVIEVLTTLFYKSREEAVKISFEVHERGEGICGLYSLEIAETKAAEAVEWARREQYPLQCRLEKA